MPRILELKEIDGHIWARIPLTDAETTQSVYVVTSEEMKQREASAIRSFCFDLANRYIEKESNPDA